MATPLSALIFATCVLLLDGASSQRKRRSLQTSSLGINVSYKSELFELQAQVARSTAAHLSAIGESVTPAMLKEMLHNNLLMFDDIYGTCIAFEPDSYPLSSNGTVDPALPGLEFGVPGTAGIDENGSSYWSGVDRPWTLPSVGLWPGKEVVLYAPYAYRGHRKGHFTYMDVNDAFNYWTPQTEWYHETRTRFLNGSLKFEEGYWTAPYFDDGAGNVSMVTYAVPFWRRTPVPNCTVPAEYVVPNCRIAPQKALYDANGEERYFWGIATIDIILDNVDFECGPTEVWSQSERRCQNCTVGWSRVESPDGTGARCQQCPPGRFSTVNGSTTCSYCDEGWYQPLSGMTSCMTCSDVVRGSVTRLIGSTQHTDCQCPAGTAYASKGDQRVCQRCPTGTFAPGLDMDQCRACPFGMVSAAGSAECGCPVGQQEVDGVCERCPIGFFKDTIMGRCQICPTDADGRNLTTTSEGAEAGGECRWCWLVILGFCVNFAVVIAFACMIPILLAVGAYVAYLRMQERSLWMIDIAELHFGDTPEILGRGTFGLVLKAEYRGTMVAVKRAIPLAAPNDRSLFGTCHSPGAVSRQVQQSSPSLTPSPVHVDENREHDPEAGVDFEFRMSSPASRPIGHTPKSGMRTLATSIHTLSRKLPCTAATTGSRSMRSRNASLKKDFINEMRVLSKLRHPCVTTVMGAVISRSTEPMLVMELMEHGSLHDLIHNETMIMEGELVLPILCDIAQGLRFLHASKPKALVHGDLKAGNVLVDAKFRAKVADFGLSQKQKLGGCGTPLWMAPEVLCGGRSSKESDVYAFGIVLIEVATRKDPYPGESAVAVCKAVADPIVNKRPVIPKSCCSELATLMRECWEAEPTLRPSFEEIERRLKMLDNQGSKQQLGSGKKSLQMSKDDQMRRTDELLYDIFPKHVAEALRDGRKVEPEHKDVVTIFFSDIVGFTDISSKLEPQKVSCMLDRLYNKFDTLSRQHGVFKVETIGDAYMAVTNLVEDQEDHARRIALFAIDAIAAANQIEVDLDDLSKGHVDIRVGFHSGPVVANVVGTRNLRYCLFGDTVNTASRMESNSAKNRIHCSADSALYLQEQCATSLSPAIRLKSRGVIDVKGKGEMETFWVSAASSAEGVQNGTQSFRIIEF